MRPSKLGALGESIAAEYLQAAGWRILARNYRVGHREIDVIARQHCVVAFVEVKSRSSARFGDPLESITARKRREILVVAQEWAQRFGARSDIYRFDAIAVYMTGRAHPTVRHVEDAWRP